MPQDLLKTFQKNDPMARFHDARRSSARNTSGQFQDVPRADSKGKNESKKASTWVDIFKKGGNDSKFDL